MSIRKTFPTLGISTLVMTAVATFLALIPAFAQGQSGSYSLLVGSGFLCELGDSSACPAVAKSLDGASYEISGAGTLTIATKVVTAAGTFTHKTAHGEVIETGVWVASELVRFDSYGTAPNAFLREGRAMGEPQLDPFRTRMFRDFMPAGGLALIRIRLLPLWGMPKTALLQVNCTLGNVPAEHQTEGIEVTLDGGGKFDEEVSGRTLFVQRSPRGEGIPKDRTPNAKVNSSP